MGPASINTSARAFDCVEVTNTSEFGTTYVHAYSCPQQMAHAFVELIENAECDWLPSIQVLCDNHAHLFCIATSCCVAF
jgi:hypothetical protein